jgi:Ice-binding-like
MLSPRTSSSRHSATSRPGIDRGRSSYRLRSSHGLRSLAVLAGTPLLSVLLIGTVFTGTAGAAVAVQLGTAAPFAVLAGSAVTDIPTSALTGDVGLSPAAGSFYTGLTQAEVHGTIYSTNSAGPAGSVNDPSLLTVAQNNLTTAYGQAADDTPTTTFTAGDNQLGGQTLVAGVYAFGHAATANITAAHPLVLNGQGDLDSVFVFQASSDLVTGVGSAVELENGAQACNVFWQVTSSATLNSGSTFVGTIMALTSATLGADASVQGRVLARNGAVTLDANTITVPTTCAVTTPPTTTTTAAAPVATTAPTGVVGSVTTASTVATGAAATGTGSAAGSTSVSAVVPAGSPHTGFGGASHSRDGTLIGMGALALAGSAGILAVAVRRRHYASRVKAITTSS